MEGRESSVGVLLLSFGSPESVDDIEPFLTGIRGKRPPQEYIEEVRQRYALIGGKSPLLEITREQARALERRLNEGLDQKRFAVSVGMRHWKPFIHEAVQQIREEPPEHLITIPLAPHYSRMNTEAYRVKVEEAMQMHECGFHFTFLDHWNDHPFLLHAFTEKVRKALLHYPLEKRDLIPLLFTAHSLPARILQEGDPYPRQVWETAQGILHLLGSPRDDRVWRVAFQSQGKTPEPWLGPTVEEVLDELSLLGTRELLLAPIGFVSDHVEILYDVDILFKEMARARGIDLIRTESLNTSLLFIETLASLVWQQALEHEADRGRFPSSQARALDGGS